MRFRVKMCVAGADHGPSVWFGGSRGRGPRQSTRRLAERFEQGRRAAGPHAPGKRRSRSNTAFFRNRPKSAESSNLEYQKVDKAVGAIETMKILPSWPNVPAKAQSDFASGTHLPIGFAVDYR